MVERLSSKPRSQAWAPAYGKEWDVTASWVCCQIPVTPVLRKQRIVISEASLGYEERPCHKQTSRRYRKHSAGGCLGGRDPWQSLGRRWMQQGRPSNYPSWRCTRCSFRNILIIFTLSWLLITGVASVVKTVPACICVLGLAWLPGSVCERMESKWLTVYVDILWLFGNGNNLGLML